MLKQYDARVSFSICEIQRIFRNCGQANSHVFSAVLFEEPCAKLANVLIQNNIGFVLALFQSFISAARVKSWKPSIFSASSSKVPDPRSLPFEKFFQ